MVLRPVGDLPPSVYWVRRLVVLLVVVVGLALVWWVWPGGSDDASPSGADTSPTPTPTVSITASTPEPSKTKTNQESTKPAEPECDDEAITVTVSTNAESYSANQRPDLTFTVENVSDETCSRDVGADANELRVTSGGTQVWSSDDCSPGGEAQFDTLKPGDRFVQTVSWDRQQSSEGCPTPQEPAEAGTYQVVARNGDVLSEPAVFVLE